MLKRITRRIEHQAAMFGRGADKWLDKPLAVFFPYAAFALIGSFHMARLVVRAAEMYGEQNGEQAGIEIGRRQGTKLGRLLQYLEGAALNGWSLTDDVFAAILEAQRDEYWPAWVAATYPGLLDEPFDCGYFVKRYNPNMRGPSSVPETQDQPAGQAAAYERTARRARRALRLDDDPYAQYRGTVLRSIPDDVDEDQADELVDAELVDDQAEETAEV